LLGFSVDVQVYPDPVRVVAIGKSVEELLAAPGADDNMGSSVEFCGGTHLTNTAEVRECCGNVVACASSHNVKWHEVAIETNSLKHCCHTLKKRGYRMCSSGYAATDTS
jgi:alanyl-tRNA synthetase